MSDLSTPTLEYYYPADHKKYLFMKLPNFLFDDPFCQKLSNNAKLLYGKLLDTMRQDKDPKADNENRVYILFSVKMTCNFLNCSESTAKRVRKELKDCFGKDIGLVKFDSHGQGNPDYVYIMHYTTSDADTKKESAPDSTNENQNELSKSVKNEPSREVIHELPRESKSEPYIIENNKEREKRKNIYHLSFTNLISKKTDDEQHYSFSPMFAVKESASDRYASVLEDFKTQIGYEQLLCYASDKTVLIDNMAQIMANEYTSCIEGTTINGRHYSRAAIRDCLKSIDFPTAKYVLDCLGRNNTKVLNIQRYILATLLNAPATYEAQKVYGRLAEQNISAEHSSNHNSAKPNTKHAYQPYIGRNYTDDEIRALELKKLGITG